MGSCSIKLRSGATLQSLIKTLQPDQEFQVVRKSEFVRAQTLRLATELLRLPRPTRSQLE
jgi:hypothetical protein